MFVEGDGSALGVMDAPHMNDLFSGEELQQAGNFVRRLLNLEQALHRPDGELRSVRVGTKPHVAGKHAGRICVEARDEGAASLMANENSLISEDLERAANGALAYLEAMREIGLIGKHVARLPDARFDHPGDFAAQLLKQRFAARKERFEYFGVLHGGHPEGFFWGRRPQF